MTRSLATALLLASTALTSTAFAQDAQPTPRAPNQLSPTFQTSPTDIGRVTVGGAPARGIIEQTGNTRQAPGGGLIQEEEAPKQRSTVTQEFIGRLSPTANPYQMMALLPGVNFASPDAFGLNGGSFNIRGLRSDQMGFTNEGVPVNDSGNYAIYPQEYIDGENMQQVVLSHGSADLDSPHIGATGGVVNMYMREPAHNLGGLVNVSAGSFGARRFFARLDTGDMQASVTNTRMFLSYSNFFTNHWKGPGTDNRQNVEFKSVTEFGQGNRVSFALLFNDALNNNYVTPSYSQYATRTGLTFDRTPNGAADTSYYGLRINPFRNLIMSAPSSFNLYDNLTYDVIPYFWYGFGNGGGATNLNENSVFYGNARVPVDLNGNGVAGENRTQLTYTPSITQTYRSGITNKLTYVMDNHRFNVGYWFEWANHRQYGTLTPTDGSSNPLDPFGQLGAVRIASGLYGGQLAQKRDITTYTTTHVLFAGDTMSFLNDRLNLDLGVKQAFITRNQEQRMPGSTPRLTLSNTETLPTGAIRYRPNDNHLLFLSVATNFRTPPNFTMQDNFSLTSGALTQRGNNSARVETSLVEEIGWRYQDNRVLGSVTLFHYDFWNRQVSTNILDPANPQSGVLIASAFNAGRTRAQGVDMEVGTRPIYNFRPYVSFEYLNTEILSNYAVQGTNAQGQKVGDYLRTANKVVPQSPRYTVGVGLTYDDGRFFGNTVIRHIDRQAATFTNDQWMKAYTRVDLMAGVYLPDMGAIQSPSLRLNLMNVTNARSLVGVNGVQVSSRQLAGVGGSTVASQGTPSYYLGNGFAALVTLTAPLNFN